MSKKEKIEPFLEEILSFWKPILINGISSNYEISRDGQVRNINTNQLLAISKDHNGYLYTSLYMNNIRYVRSIHRLVAKAFVDNPLNKPIVNHIDSNPENNHYTNLEWCTQSENMQHAVKYGNKPTGSDCSFAKYTDEQIHHVCRLLQEDKIILEKIAGLTGVKIGTVFDIKSGKSWKDISEHYSIPRPISNRHGNVHHSSKLNEDQVHLICQELTDPMVTFNDIITKLHVKKSDINNIVQGKAWKYISSQYEIPMRERSIRRKRICDLFNKGSDVDEITEIIMAEFNMSERKTARHCVTSIIRYYKLRER